MAYKVKYEDWSRNEYSIDEYESEEVAERAIDEEMERLKEQLLDHFYVDTEKKTEIWSHGERWASWTRLWK